MEANCVYVIPPNTNLGIARGVLKLEPRPETRTPHRSIDFFFESLARDQREWAIGVILSGTATDGTLGFTAIKAEGGITFAQDASARYDSLPRSAVAAGCVDFVLSPENIAKELARIATHPYVAGQPPESPTPADDDRAGGTAHADDDMSPPSGGRGTRRTGAQQARAKAKRGRGERAGAQGAENGFKKVLLLLRNHSGVDFSLYKSATIQRRITRRMVLNEDTLESYAHFLQGNAKELDALYSDALISVSSFFATQKRSTCSGARSFPSSSSSSATNRSALGCSGVPPARRRIPLPWRSWKRRRTRPACPSSRCSPPTSMMRCSIKPATVFTPRASWTMSRRTDAVRHHPRFFERVVWNPDALFGSGSEERTVIYLGAGLDTQPGVSPGGRNPEHIRCERERLTEVVLALRALFAGAALKAKTVAGVKTALLATLIERLRGARYGVILWAAGDLDPQSADLTIEVIVDLIMISNERTRCAHSAATTAA